MIGCIHLLHASVVTSDGQLVILYTFGVLAIQHSNTVFALNTVQNATVLSGAARRGKALLFPSHSAVEHLL